jgi:DNA primase
MGLNVASVLPKGDSRAEWVRERSGVDLVRLATSLLGPAQQRRGGAGRSWWRCPFHDDANPSFCIQPKGTRWKCYGCDVEGDAVDLVRRLDSSLTFPQAVDVILNRPAARTTTRPTRQVQAATRPQRPQDVRHEPDDDPTGLEADEAAAVVWDASERLWLADEAEAGRQELAKRGISAGAADRSGIGWVDRLDVPTASGGIMTVRGLCLPWWNRDGLLACLKIRRMDGRQPKYVQAFKNPKRWTGIYPAPSWVIPGRPLVIVEGELDALCLASALEGLAVGVVTLGSASMKPDHAILAALLPASCWNVATDNDPAGEKAAQAWPATARRIRPPEPYKDWCEAAASSENLKTWWSDRFSLHSSVA